MSISIDPQEGGPIEGLFGSQVGQRIGHHVEHDDEPSLIRRISEAEGRLLGAQTSSSSRPMASPSSRPNYSQKSWIKRVLWSPREQDQSLNPMGAHRSPQSTGSHRRGPSWWGSRLYNKITLGMLPTTSNTPSPASTSNFGVFHYIWAPLMPCIALVAGIVTNKRRKSWFLSLIMISLVLTVLSGGYLLGQFQYQRDHMPPAVPLPGKGTAGDLLVDPGSEGPRRDRSRGKHQKAPKKQPEQPSSNKTTNSGPEKVIPNIPAPSIINPSDETTGTRICTLEDVAKGQWIYFKTQDKAPEWSPDQDMSWTGYGHKGCQSSIWNERYLLTPAITNLTTTRYPSIPDLQNDLNYAHHLRNFQWQLLNEKSQNQGSQGTEGKCQQPGMDIEDFVEVLKRAPLIMIGDKFLEQEYLTIECLVMGMQERLKLEYKSENTKKPIDEKNMRKALEYWIETEAPPVVEFKAAPHSNNRVSGSTSSGKDRPTVYRKAKPGQLRLVDRTSNLTLVTFIRSDVLWDSGMLNSQIFRHPVKSDVEQSSADANGLHPDCNLVGTTLMCEPARIDSSIAEKLQGNKLDKKSSVKHWWQWWIGTETEQSHDENDSDEGGGAEVEDDMSFGSDFDHDMINLEWVQALENIVKDTEEHHSKQSVERKPVIVISNGHFWAYDPRDVTALMRLSRDEKLNINSKSEQGKLRHNQILRRKLLRQRL
ncbi:hypothetical protein BGZ76_005952 [Entomortierella beljakovae]|nr:hypothetical protein BGZ76_005952 [Entomortierella beljakovae]